jgi:nucleoside-diphosphate-sugar epimerase
MTMTPYIKPDADELRSKRRIRHRDRSRRGDRYADPMLDSRITAAELGVHPRTLEDGLRSTVTWLRRNGKI